MQQVSERRKSARTKKIPPHTLRLAIDEGTGVPRQEVVGKLLETSDDGLRIALSRPLKVGSVVHLSREAMASHGKKEPWLGRVTWCGVDREGVFTVGLQLQAPAGSTSGGEHKKPEAEPTAVADHYEVLQLNTKADPDTIHRVYRLLATRYHPDNPDTGNGEQFRRLLEAYKVLSDPEQRAAYDVQHGSQKQRRWKIFDPLTAAPGRADELRKRAGILCVLYTRRLNEPAAPTMNLHEIEDLLNCPREHLEFSLWYLKEKNFVVRSDNGRYAITVLGADEAERNDLPWAKDRLLPLPQGAA